jgi:hypothetical protein
LSFKANQRAGLGYLDEDSAGQTNIFAVEPKQYIQGSRQDPEVNPNANILLVSAGSVALALVAAGLVKGFTTDTIPIEDTPGQFRTLTQYAQRFSGTDIAGAPQL